MNDIYVSTSVLEDGLPASVAVEKLIQMGICNIEIGSTHVPEDKQVEKLACYKDVNFIVHNFFPPADKSLVVNLASQDAGVLQLSIEQVKRSIDLCAELGVRHYSFHPGFLSDVQKKMVNLETRDYDFSFAPIEVTREKAFETFICSVSELCEYAEDKDILISCENSGSISKNDYLLMNTAEEFEMLFSQVKSPNLGMLLDLGHLKLASIANKFDPDEFVVQLKYFIRELHIHENNSINDQHSGLMNSRWSVGMISRHGLDVGYHTLEGRNLTSEETKLSYEILNRNKLRRESSTVNKDSFVCL